MIFRVNRFFFLFFFIETLSRPFLGLAGLFFFLFFHFPIHPLRNSFDTSSMIFRSCTHRWDAGRGEAWAWAWASTYLCSTYLSSDGHGHGHGRGELDVT